MNMNIMSKRSQKHNVERACGLELFGDERDRSYRSGDEPVERIASQSR
jgi:hypothetical protein